ncbi:MAG: PAS domain S-box protein, partial [Acidobacteriota bacterium]|nr:PAS domain S-box protein [Acidobacteriota bacterium]
MQFINPTSSHNILESRLPATPRWYRVYYFLAAFNVLVVLLGLLLTHQMLKIHKGSIEVNQRWVEHRNAVRDLGTLSGAVNAPGNDVFGSHDVEIESARMKVAVGAFNDRMAVVEKDLLAQSETKNRSNAEIQPYLARLPKDVAAIKIAMQEMVNEAELVFSDFQQHQFEMAGSRMATMDRKFAKVSASLSQLHKDIGDVQEELFNKEAQSAESLSKLEYLLASLVLLMVSGAILYGHQIKNKIESGTREKQGYLEELQAEISERKAIESALRESEERHRNLFENANDIIYTHDLEGNYTSVNKVCQKVTGYTTTEALEMNVRQLIAPEFLAFATEMVARKGTGKSQAAYEIEVIAKDGHRVTLEVNSRLTFQNGKPFAV